MALKTKMYRTQHEELLRLAARITAADSAGGLEIGLALARLKGVLGVHLKLEDDSLYPAMLAHSSADVRAKAEKYQREMGALAATFASFYDKWASNAGAVEADPDGFRRDWFSVLRALEARIDAEERDLYELVDAAGLRVSV